MNEEKLTDVLHQVLKLVVNFGNYIGIFVILLPYICSFIQHFVHLVCGHQLYLIQQCLFQLWCTRISAAISNSLYLSRNKPCSIVWSAQV
ncbi:hypothetical protein FKM82_014310 [Ascaphus truei]